jgi:hypothetical protein
MKVGIVIPWRPSPTRIEAFNFCIKYYTETFPNWTIYYGDSSDEIFNVSEARNNGCLQAIKDGCSVLLIVDADTVVEEASVIRSIDVAIDRQIVSHPYESSFYLELGQSNRILANNEPLFNNDYRLASHEINHPGSAWVMTAAAFITLNGWDERFTGWGYEDNALSSAHNAIYGVPIHRGIGTSQRFNHEDRSAHTLVENKERYDLYKEAENNREEMLNIVSGNMVSKDKDVKY